MSTLLASGHVLIGAQISPALAGMAKVQAQFLATGNKMARTGTLISKGIGLPIAAGFAFAIKAAGDFEASLNDMQAVSGATERQMRAVGKTAKALGADVKLPGTSAKDAADAMVQLAKGGFTAEQAMDAARGTLLLSAAAGIENAHAAEIQADALNGFGLSAKSASKVSDLLAASANASTAEITDMAMSLSQSSAVAKQANYSIEDTVTALSMLANAGIKGSDAGTSLKTMLLRLQAPLGPAKAAIKDLGINLRDSGGELKKLPALANEFTNATKNLDRAQRDAAFAAIFGSDAIRAANILLGQGAGAHEKMKAKVTEQGAAAKLAAAKMKGFNGSLEALKSAAETAAISLGTILLPIAKNIVEGFTAAASAFEMLSPEMKKVTTAGLAAAAVLGPMILIVGKLAIALKALGLTMAIATGPVGLIIAGLLALGVGLYIAWQRSETFRQIVTTAFEAIRARAIPVIAAVTAAVGTMAAFFKLHWGEISATATAAMERIRTAITVGIAVIKAIWGPYWPTIATAVRSAFTVIVSAVETNMRIIGNVIRAVMAVIRGDWSGAWNAMKAAAAAAITGGAATVKAIISGLASTVGALAKAIGSQIVKGIKAGLAALSSIYATMWSAISGAVSGVAAAAFGAAAAIGRAIISGVVSGLGGLAGAIASKVNSGIRAGLDAVNPFSPVEHGGEIYIGKPIVDGAVKGIEKNAGALKGALNNAVSMSVKGSLATLRALQGQLDQINAARASKDRQLALADAQAALADARKKGEGVAAAERAVNRARQDITIAGIEARLAIAQRGADREKAIVDRMNERIKKGIEDLKRARDNAANLASGLGGMIGQGVDALAGRNLALLGNSPEAQRLRDIETQQRAVSLIRERNRLDEAIRTAETAEDRMRAQSDLDDWILEQERQTIAESLARKEQAIRDEADAKKTAAERGIADLTSAFNRGLLTHQQYIASVNALVGAQVGDYNDLGSMLGGAFRFGFEEQLRALFATVSNVAKLVAPTSAAAKITLPAGPDRPRRAKLGGIVGGSGMTDKVPLLAAPGEGVLSHRGMDNLMDMAMGRGGGGGGHTSLTVNIYDRTTTGMSREQARRLADQIAPELNRRVALTG